jgi:SAM-dependent methyltransferase
MKPTWFSYRDRNSSYDEILSDLVESARSIVGKTNLPPDFLRRYEVATGYTAPFLQASIPNIGEKKAVEVGCGPGAKLVSLSHLFAQYWGADISAPTLAKAERLAKQMGVRNATLAHVEAKNMRALLEREHFDVIILFAVLEHLTIEEKITLLRECWEALPDDGYLYFAEAPNRAAPVDLHSSRLAHFNHLPLDLARLYYSKSKSQRFVSKVRAEGATDLSFYRHGVHVGFHEFELAFGSLDVIANHLVAHNFHPHLLNLYPVRWFEEQLWRNLDVFAKPAVAMQKIDVPKIFARYWIEGILSKRPRAAPLKVEKVSPTAADARKYLATTTRRDGYQVNHGDALSLAKPTAPGNATVTVGIHRANSRGAFEFATADGSVILETSLAELASIKPPHREWQHWFSLPPIAQDKWPICIRPKGVGSRIYMIDALAETGAELE